MLGIASESFTGENGRYVGIDVSKDDVDFCTGHYDSKRYSFIHFNINNPAYASEQTTEKRNWDVGNARFNLVTALSVWTHLNEDDARYYFREIERVLKPGGKAIITFFLLDDLYEHSLHIRSNTKGRYHSTSQSDWIFDRSAYGSDAWFCPEWANCPEDAIGITSAGLDLLIRESGLKKTAFYQGNWKEIPGVYFQDIIVFEKP